MATENKLKFFQHQRTCKKPEVLFYRTVDQVQNLYVGEDGVGYIDNNRFEVDQELKTWLECHDCHAKRIDTDIIVQDGK